MIAPRVTDLPADWCPFHDLPPAQTVWVLLGGYALPYSAEYACGQFHTGETIARVMGPNPGERTDR